MAARVDDEPRVRRVPLPPFEAWLGTLALYAGVTYFWHIVPTEGTTLAIQHSFPALAAAWSVLYGLGGLCIICGLLRHSPPVEGAGLCLLGSGLIVSTLAIVETTTGTRVIPSLIFEGGLVIACFQRLISLRRFQ